MICTGAWTDALARWLSLDPTPRLDWLPAGRVPIEPVRGQSLELRPASPAIPSVLKGRDVYLVPRRDGGIVVGATEERVGFDASTTEAGLAGLRDAAVALVPELARAETVRAWAGLRPASPDGLPLVGPAPGIDGLWLAAGHTRNGILLAPLTAEWIADGIAGRPLPEEAESLRPERFAPTSA